MVDTGSFTVTCNKVVSLKTVSGSAIQSLNGTHGQWSRKPNRSSINIFFFLFKRGLKAKRCQQHKALAYLVMFCSLVKLSLRASSYEPG